MDIKMTKLITRSYEVILPRLPEAFEKSRIVFLSDLHGCCYGKHNQLLLAAVEAAKPHFVLVGGDMLLGLRRAEQWEQTGGRVAEALLVRLAKRYPVYYTDGNHEGKCPPEQIREYQSRLMRAGVIFVNNTRCTLEKKGHSLFLHGLVQEKRWYPKGRRLSYPLEDMIKKLGCYPAGERDGSCHILMAHHPAYFKTYEKWGADLVLSGHLHGGVVRLPFVGGLLGPDFLPFPPYSGGLYARGNSQLLVSCGLGTHTIPFRLFNPPEVSLIILKKNADGCLRREHRK